MKNNIRVIGIDDGPFKRGTDIETCITGVVMRLDGTIEDIRIRMLKIDDANVLETISALIPENSRTLIKAVISEGVTFGGFGLIDPESFFVYTSIPFISITKGKASLEAMKRALSAHHSYASILQTLEKLKPLRVELNKRQYMLNYSGITESDAILILKKLMLTGNVPEPVRLAHIISRAVYDIKNTQIKKM